MRRWFGMAAKTVAWLLLIAAIALNLAVANIRQGLGDFGSFVAAGKAEQSGMDPYGFDFLGPDAEARWPNMNPPISILLFRPLAHVDAYAAMHLWRIISVALYLAALALLALRYRPSALQLGWAVALAGFWHVVDLGQIYVPVLLLVIAAWILLESGRTVAAGVLIGLAVALKPNLAVWPLLLIIGGGARAGFTALGVAVLASVLPVCALGSEPYRGYLDLISRAGPSPTLLNSSLPSVASRLGVPEAALPISAGALAAAAYWAHRYHPPRSYLSAMGLVISLIASPIAWVGYTLLLLPPLLSERWHLGHLIPLALLVVPAPLIRLAANLWPSWQALFGSFYVAPLVAIAVLWARSGTRVTPTPTSRAGLCGRRPKCKSR